MKTLLLSIYLLLAFFFEGFCQFKPDTLVFNNVIKIDLFPLYHDLFDNRVQIRTGIEYERRLTDKSFFSSYLDIGVYDKYNFIKYFNFFNQNQGLYFQRQKVLVAGIHLLPSYNYDIITFGKKKNNTIFSGTLADLSYYHKTSHYFNSLTLENLSSTYFQLRAGAGISAGFKKQYSRIFLELKTSILFRTFNYISTSGGSPIKSMDAQWTSMNYKFWWINNIKIGYAF